MTGGYLAHCEGGLKVGGSSAQRVVDIKGYFVKKKGNYRKGKREEEEMEEEERERSLN
jgi:hypothetical protein